MLVYFSTPYTEKIKASVLYTFVVVIAFPLATSLLLFPEWPSYYCFSFNWWGKEI